MLENNISIQYQIKLVAFVLFKKFLHKTSSRALLFRRNWKFSGLWKIGAL